MHRRARRSRGAFLAALAAVSLAACSGDPAVRIVGGPDDGSGVATGDGGEGEQPGGSGADGGSGDEGAPPVTDEGGPEDASVLPPGSRAGAYVGRLDDGEGVFVLDRAERLIGLTARPDGSGSSWFADFGEGTASGPVSRFEHASVDRPGVPDASVPGAAPSPLGARAGEGPGLGLVAGERIEGVTGDTDVSLEASGRDTLAPVTRASLAGRWSGEFADCDSLGEHCSRLVVTLDIDALRLAGSSGVLTADGTDLFPVPMSGELVPLGDFAEARFEWNTYDYDGAVHFAPGRDDRLVLIGYTDRELADHPVFAAVLERVPGG